MIRKKSGFCHKAIDNIPRICYNILVYFHKYNNGGFL